ncbi:hypothetical protein ACPV3S_19365 [Photobacterium damselae]|uniref:hypothetical protein n=1 Tax=Photobacterium damselae TaxID=38293 RepID=UPI0040685F87
MNNVHSFKSALDIINALAFLLIAGLVCVAIYGLAKEQYDVLGLGLGSAFIIWFMKSLGLGIGYCVAQTAINTAIIAKNTAPQETE